MAAETTPHPNPSPKGEGLNHATSLADAKLNVELKTQALAGFAEHFSLQAARMLVFR